MTELRDYQEEGVKLLRKYQKFSIWDKPGMGKTLQGVYAAVKPCIVACPTYLTEQWADVIAQEFPEDSIALCIGSKLDKLKLLSAKADWTIVNIEMFRTFDINPIKYKTLIIDEAHHVRGRKALQSRNIFKFSKELEYVFMLTATPIKNEPDDMFMQLRILDPKRFTSYQAFEDEYLTVVKTSYDPLITGVQSEEEFKALLKQYGIRRSYEETGRPLPEVLPPIILKIKGSPEWYKKYKEVKDQYVLEDLSMTSQSQVYHILRQLCLCEDKVNALKEVVDDLDERGSVIFTWYKETARSLGNTLKVPFIIGETPANERRIIANKNSIVVANLAAMTEGVDLSEKNTVIFFEIDYVPGVMEQALTRVVRERKDKSRTDPVRVYYIMMDKTIETNILNKVNNRAITIFNILKEELNANRIK